jgi:hypothetical protein
MKTKEEISVALDKARRDLEAAAQNWVSNMQELTEYSVTYSTSTLTVRLYGKIRDIEATDILHATDLRDADTQLFTRGYLMASNWKSITATRYVASVWLLADVKAYIARVDKDKTHG